MPAGSARAAAGRLYIANRGADRARRLATAYDAEVVPIDEVAEALAGVDVVVCATASPETILDAGMIGARTSPLLVLDLAVPRDVAPGVADLPGVVLVDLERLGLATGEPHTDATDPGLGLPADAEVRAAEAIVAAEVEAFRNWLRSSDVAPTVAALRARGDDVVAQVLAENDGRWESLGERDRRRVEALARAVANRLLHEPTLRVKGLDAAHRHARLQLLRELFGLEDAEAAQAAERPAEVRPLRRP